VEQEQRGGDGKEEAIRGERGRERRWKDGVGRKAAEEKKEG
jgi:hypothetical protein